MQRVMIVGGPGSGKSTLARALGDITGLPVFHMDQIHYSAGWTERSKSEKTIMAQAIHRKDQWIFEGGHSSTYAERASRADTLIWLDVGLIKRLYRVIARSYKYQGQSRPDLSPGCPEQFNKETIKFLGFILRSNRTAREKIMRVIDDQSEGLEIIRLTDNRSVKLYLSRLARSELSVTYD